MRRKTADYSVQDLKSCIVEALQSKKGHAIIDMDMTGLKELLFDHFIVCHGDSTTQVTALAEVVESSVAEKFHLKVHHREGYQQAQWILLDFREVIVHIFLKPLRDFYNLEGLYADASFEHVSEM